MTSDAAAQDDPLTLSDLLAVLFAAAGLAAGVILVLKSPEAEMQLHGAILAVACAIFFVLIGMVGKSSEAHSDNVIKAAVVAVVYWGVTGFLVGDYIAWELAFPDLNFDLPWTNFGRLRPLHASATIFAFGGNALLAASFYCVQRTRRTRLYGRFAPWFVFIGYNTMLVIAGTGYVLGVTQGKEYAEPEWYADLWFVLVWTIYLLVFVGALWRCREPRIPVANWFYLLFIGVAALLHITSNLAAPASLLGSKSYVAYVGAQDAWTQWLYSHNAVGFVLTAGFLGVMYDFIPARAGRPVYSNNMAIAHCVALCYAFIWGGPSRLHSAAYPDWAQELAPTFQAVAWVACLAGMLNLMMTPGAWKMTPGAWKKLGSDPVMRFLMLALALKTVDIALNYDGSSVNRLHAREFSWGAMAVFGAAYCLVPWLWKREQLYSTALVEAHFWLCCLGMLLYFSSTWLAGIMQRLMWQAYDNHGFLQYSFVESVEAMHPYYIVNATGGVLFTLGALIMACNLLLTIAAPPSASVTVLPTPGSPLPVR